jgi:hypothetical protein
MIKETIGTAHNFFSLIQYWAVWWASFPLINLPNRNWKSFCIDAGLGDINEWGFRYATDVDGNNDPDIKRGGEISNDRFATKGDISGPWLLEDIAIAMINIDDGIESLSFSGTFTGDLSGFTLDPFTLTFPTEPSFPETGGN